MRYYNSFTLRKVQQCLFLIVLASSQHDEIHRFYVLKKTLRITQRKTSSSERSIKLCSDEDVLRCVLRCVMRCVFFNKYFTMLSNLIKHWNFQLPKHNLCISLIRNRFKLFQSLLKLFIKLQHHFTHCVMRKIRKISNFA